MLRPALTRCSLLLGLLLPVVAEAAELYRYVDDKGTTVLSRQGVPPEYIGRGYEVLNDQGRVIQVIAPAPSPEEMKRILADKARASSDTQLLRLYSTPEDVERARAQAGRAGWPDWCGARQPAVGAHAAGQSAEPGRRS